MKLVKLDPAHAKQFGRTLIDGDILKLILSGTGCEFIFTGKKLVMSFGSGGIADSWSFPRIAVLVNEKFIVKKTINSAREEFTIFKSRSISTIKVRIIKLSESAFSIAEVFPIEIDDSEIIVPSPERPLKIEFIGDSITCGYGVDDSNIDALFSTCSENVMKSFSYRTAQILNADHSIFSASGYGIISGFTTNNTRKSTECIPHYYKSFGYSLCKVFSDTYPQDIEWNFNRFIPDAIVINLGTNDHSFCKKNNLLKQEFENAYLEFLKTVRRMNPDSHIFCVLGIMESELFPQVQNACNRFINTTGDMKIHTLEFELQDGNLGYAVNWHPSEDTHSFAAEKLAAFISDKLKEKR